MMERHDAIGERRYSEVPTRTKEPVEHYDSEPRWPAVIAAVAVGGLYTALPDALTLGPNWVLPSVVLGLLIPNVVYHHAGRHRLTAIFGLAVNAVLTAGLIISVILLVKCSPYRERDTAAALALSGIALGHEHFSFCFVVLAAGRRRTLSAG